MQPPQAKLGLALAVVLICGFFTQIGNAQGPRPLAKGVLVTIPEDLNPRDMFSLPRPLPDLVADKYEPLTFPYQTTLHGQGGQVVMFRDNVWQYEFSFIGLRQAKLQLPDENGEIKTKLVWYMVYRIRDTGKTMTFEQVKQSKNFDHVKFDLRRDQPVARSKRKFLPRFTLEGSVSQRDGSYKKMVYRDVIDPLAVEQIRMQEDENMRLFDSHQMSQVNVPSARKTSDPGVWGVAIWEDVNPNIDYISVFVKGLTNAFRLGKTMNDDNLLKTLQLNFWRPGDTFREERDFVTYGIPLVDDPVKQIEICERYKLPGPVIRGYVVDEIAKRDILVVETDAKINLRDFSSGLAPELDKGNMPPSVAKAFVDSGIQLGGNANVNTLVPGQRWSFELNGKTYILALEPQYWAPDFGNIKFIKRLDHMWIYR